MDSFYDWAAGWIAWLRSDVRRDDAALADHEARIARLEAFVADAASSSTTRDLAAARRKLEAAIDEQLNIDRGESA